MEKYNKQKAILTALLKWVETEFFGIFVFLFFIAVAKPFGALANIIFGLTGLLTVVCLMADFGLKQGEEARNKVTFHGEKDCPNYGFTLGLIASIPCYITMILLMISKFSGSFNFMPAYKLLDACFYPLIDWAAHSADVKDMPEFFQQEKYEGKSMICKKLNMLPIECIVRGYITGSGWESYKKNGTVCGIKLPEGLKEADKLPEPIYTPSTKAEIGDHDENISYEQSVEYLEKRFPGKGAEYAAKLRDYTIAIYKKCADYALTKGIIIADTKFEFGLDENGNMVLGDEVLTPDSSRFWPVDGYEPGHGQPSFDKQFARDWLKANPEKGWKLPEDIVEKTIDKYLQAYKMLTGKDL